MKHEGTPLGGRYMDLEGGRLKNMPEKKNNTVGLTVALLVALLLGGLLGSQSDSRVMADSGSFDQLKVFSEVLSHIQNKYVEDVDTDELVAGAIKGMMDTLDPHSSFMKKSSYADLKVDTKGEFGGIGIQISVRDHKLVIIAPIEDTPADRAGLMSGDHIFKVDGAPTKEMTISDAVDRMRGLKGEPVELTIIREGEDSKPFDVSLVRDTIKIKSVRSRVVEPGIGYIRISQFQERTGADLRKQLKELSKEGLEGLVLDLRNNPGGLLTAAVEVSQQFLEAGQLVVYIQDRNGKREEYFAQSGRRHNDYPIVVLVNRGSASASEIVAGAIQDLGRGVVVGTVSFGKGSVQTIMPLSDDSALRLTTAKYYTPAGRSIQNTGITPDIVVELQLEKAKDEELASLFRREKDLDGHLSNGTVDKEEDKPKDAPKLNERTIGGKEMSDDDADSAKLTPEEEMWARDNQLRAAVNLLKGWRILRGQQPTVMTAKGA